MAFLLCSVEWKIDLRCLSLLGFVWHEGGWAILGRRLWGAVPVGNLLAVWQIQDCKFCACYHRGFEVKWLLESGVG